MLVRGTLIEMFSAPTITEDSKSYMMFDRRSIDDFDYRPYDVSIKTHRCTHSHISA